MRRKIIVDFAENHIVRRGLTAFVVSLFVATIGVLVLDVSRQMDRLTSSSADNMQWTLGQAETELATLEITTLRAILDRDQGDLEEVRLRFNIFYSRVQTLIDSLVFRGLRNEHGVQVQLAEIAQWRDEWVPVIDGSDAVLRASLPRLSAEIAAMRAPVRRTTLDGVDYYSRIGDARRDSILRTLFRIGVLTVTLVAILLILILMLVRLARQQEQSARVNREMGERMETIIATSLDAIVVIDRNGRIIEYNGAAERIFGFTRDQAIGTDVADLLIPDHLRSRHNAAMSRYLATGETRMIGKGIVQLDARRRDGSIFPVDLSLARAQSPEGEIFVGFMRDISDRVRDEKALRLARDRAIAGERQKAELLAVMSHEMRTPLNGMLGTLELFDGDNLDPRQKRFLRIIRNSGKVLLGHVNDVLDISRLDAGKLRLRKRHFDLVKLLEEVIDNQLERAHARGNTLVLAPPSPALHHVWSDPDRLRQILLNLVSNAVKFTSDGTITVEVDCSAGLDAVEFRVIDSGIGIQDTDLDRIFGDFETIDHSYARQSSGTGLGLGIARRLAKALGGELGGESEPGEGSVFFLSLPMDSPKGRLADAPADSDAPPAEQFALAPLRVLLVEDNEINRLVAREFLERDGHVVTEADCGAEGVALAHDTRFDVILMDISMPGTSGIEAARRIRAGQGASADTPIVATTAHALREERQAFRAAGMSQVLAKPISGAALRDVLHTAISGRERAPEDAPPIDPDHQVVNRLHLAELVQELSPERMSQALARFTTEMQAFLAQMPEQLRGDALQRQALAEEAHRMAGSAGVFGAMRLTGLLRQVQAEAGWTSQSRLEQHHTTLCALWSDTREALIHAGATAGVQST